MPTPLPHSARPSALALLFALAGCVCPLTAQDFTLRLGQSGYESVDAVFPEEALGGLKGGFYFGLAGNVTYDSNFFIDDDYTESELTTVVAPWMSYRSDPEGGARISVEASYSPALQVYMNNSDFTGVDHSGSVAITYRANRTTLSLHADYAEVSMADRIAGDFVEGSILSYGIDGSHQLGPRTTLFGSWVAAMTDYDSGGRTGADSYTAEVAGLWDASERLRFGPALRYSVTESDATGERDALALLLKARFKSGERLRLAASGGVEFEKNSRLGNDWDPSLTGGLSADYLLSERWSFRATIRYATVPSPSNLNYQVNDLSFTSAVIRHFERASLELGAGIGMSDYEAVGRVAANQQDDDYLTAYLTYRRKIFSDRVTFDSTVRGSTNDGQKDWSQWQISTGLRMEF
jgi:hypothetical protein